MPSVELEGYDEIQQLLQKMVKKTDDTAPVMAEIANSLYNITMESFAGQKSPSGAPWQRLAPSTLRRKKHPGKILYETGQLHRRIYTRSDKDSAEIGVNLPYAAIHQFGGHAGRGRKVSIPARPYLPLEGDGLSKVVWDEISEILEGVLDESTF